MNIFEKAYKFNLLMVFKFVACLVQEKTAYKMFVCLNKQLQILTKFSGSRIIVSVPASLCHWSILSNVHPSLDAGKLV
jgi:hypothetical protein